MNNVQFYKWVLSKTLELKIKPVVRLNSDSNYLKLLIETQLTDENLKELQWFSNQKQFKEALHSFNPMEIVKEGKYLNFLDRVLDIFEPENVSVYKKLTKIAFQSSKYIVSSGGLISLNEKIEAIKDYDELLTFIDGFRKESGLQDMYFIKTCRFFQNSGLLDIPVPNAHAKDILIEKMSLVDDNKEIFGKLIDILDENNISGFELNQRLDAINI
jgi:hypothetical protein